MNRKKILLAFFKPQGMYLKYICAAYLFFSSATVALIYYSINYEICADNVCSKLLVNKNWQSLDPFLWILSGSMLLVGIFVLKSKELPRIYSLALAFGFGAATILSGKLFFLIQYEIKINT